MYANRSEKRRRRTKGRADWSFISLPHYILQSAEFGRLTAYGTKLLIELASSYKGSNNGDLSAAFSALKNRGWRSAGTLSKALRELQERGFIIVARQGGRNRCSLYAITWWPIDECSGKLEVASEVLARHSWKDDSCSRYANSGSRKADQLPEGGVPRSSV